METQIKRISKKQEAINSFLSKEKWAIENRKDYVPIKDLDFLVSFDGYLTYEGNVLYKYLKENGYQATRASYHAEAGKEHHGNTKVILLKSSEVLNATFNSERASLE